MINQNLSLSRSDVLDFMHLNQKAVLFRHIASNDYIGSRLCINQALLSQGFMLAEQAIEKELKSILLLLNREENLKKLGNHKIEPIIEKIQSERDLGLAIFQTFGKRLSDIYELTRYPDHRFKGSNEYNHWSMSGRELEVVDEMFFFLNEVSPLPDEIKYRSGIYATICDNSDESSDPRYFPKKQWAIINNKAYDARAAKLHSRFAEVNAHLYPAD